MLLRDLFVARFRPVPCLFLVAAIIFQSPAASADQCDIPMFAGARTFDSGTVPAAVVVGDFNKDGLSDFAVANQDSTNTVFIFLGMGNGNFQSPVRYTAGFFPQSIQVVDLNGDPNPDLVVTAAGQSFKLFGNGDGTFQKATQITGSSGDAIAFGKFGPDTNVDLVSGINGNTYVYAQRGNGNGTFQAVEPYLITPFGDAPASLAIDDMNADGKQDIVAGTTGSSAGSIDVFLGKGDGTFFDATNSLASVNNSSLALGDFNRDGAPDLLMTQVNGHRSCLRTSSATATG
jgi:hypothetical protein